MEPTCEACGVSLIQCICEGEARAAMFVHPDDCKHPTEHLIVQRNNGHRWISCLLCCSDFERVELVENDASR